MCCGGRLTAGDPHVVIVDEPEEDAVVVRRGDDGPGPLWRLDQQGVEELVRGQLEPGSLQSRRRSPRFGVDAPGDAAQAIGTVVHGVHGCHHGQEHLGRADVRGGLLASDVLLTRLQGQPVGGPLLGVDREADQSPGQVALQARPYRHEGRMRSAVPERNAESLRGSHDDIGTPLPRRRQHRERQEIGCHRDQRTARMGFLGHGGESRGSSPNSSGIAATTPNRSPAGSPWSRSATTTSIPSGARRVFRTARV